MIEKGTYYKFGNKKVFVSFKKDVYENLYLQAIIDSYQNIDKTAGLENEIRDKIVWDLQNNNPLTTGLFQTEILDIIFSIQQKKAV